MRKHLTALLAVCLCVLAACAVSDPAAEAAPSPVYPPAAYQLDTMTAQETFTGNTGAVFADYSYELPTLSVVNLEELSPEDRERAEGNAAAFNQKMGQLLDDSVASGREMADMAQRAYEAGAAAVMGEGYFDHTTSVTNRVGSILSVRLDNESYRGGAHAGQVTTGLLFDLEAGHFIDPAQLADDQESFVKGVAELLTALPEVKKNAATMYWPDHGEILSRWNRAAVLLDDTGMTVVFSPYELGPYALGTVELRLSYDQLYDLLGPGGRERLGIAEKETI